MQVIKKLEQTCMKEQLPDFKVGDVVDVRVRIREGDKERVQTFNGTVIRIKAGRGIRGSFTVRRIVQGEGVERVFPFHSPAVEGVIVKRPGKVRRAKLYYLRERVGKATKVKERREDDKDTAAGEGGGSGGKKARRQKVAAEVEA
jgi:large subunit ribosomal protein L19